MQKTIVVLAVLLCASAALAQFVERVVDLPDSSGPIALCYVPTVHKVYCCNELTDSVSVIDAATNSFIRSIPAGDRPYAMCYNSLNDRVYVANHASNNVMVIDPATDIVVATVAVGALPNELCYNAAKNKVYSANYDGNSVSIINGATNTLIGTVGPLAARFICSNSSGKKVFVTKLYQAYVIDGVLDALVDSFPVGELPHDIMCAPATNKLYLTDWVGPYVWVMDAGPDTLVTKVMVGANVNSDGLCYNTHNNKVYCSTWANSRVVVIDGASDTVTTAIVVGTNPSALCYDSIHNKVYCANYGDSVVHIIGGATDSIVAACTTGMGPVDFACAPNLNKMFVANYLGSSIAVIRDTTPADIAELLHGSPSWAQPLPTIRRGPTPRVMAGATLRDISGRKVAVLEQGVDYTSGLTPGVYFVCESPQTVRKVILIR